jgi:glycosyltransferase 2 family protein
VRVAGTRSFFFLLRTAVTIAVLGVVFAYCGISRLFDTIGQLNLGWVLVGFTLAVAQVFLLAWRWQLLCAALSGQAPRFAIFLFAFGRSLLVGQLLPSTVGTDAVRALALIRVIGATGAIRSVICDRLLGLFALTLLVDAELPIFAQNAASSTAIFSLAFVSLMVGGGFMAIMGFRRWLPQIPLIGRYTAVVASDLWHVLFRPNGRIAFGLGFIAHLTSALIFVALVRSVDAEISPIFSGLVILPALLVIAVPISLGGWGIREAVIASGFTLLGSDPVPAVTASILFGLSGPMGGAAVELLALITQANGIIRDRAS